MLHTLGMMHMLHIRGTLQKQCIHTSVLTNKVGELVAAVHTSIACRALKLYFARKPVTVLKGHGLHIHRALGIYHIVVTVSRDQPIMLKYLPIMLCCTA